jgi:(+)-pinoresinol hydroxylase
MMYSRKAWLSGCCALLASGITATVAVCAEATNQLAESSVGGVVRKPEQSGPVASGYLVFQKWCAGCHAPDYVPGLGAAADVPAPLRSALGTQKLRLKYGEQEPAALEMRTDLSAALIRVYVRRGVALMPAFRKTELNDAELSDLVAYLNRNTLSQ